MPPRLPRPAVICTAGQPVAADPFPGYVLPMGAAFTLGAEEELHLIDLDRWELSARAPQILSRLPSAFYSAEIQRTTVETNTAVVRTLTDLREELLRLRRNVIEVAAQENLGVAAVGTAPRSTYADFELTSTGRYSRMHEQYRLLVDEQLICGTQIHVGIEDRDVAVDIGQRIARDLPVLLALSASSPYWNGQDTGYASIRTIIWQRWPSAGSPGRISSAALTASRSRSRAWRSSSTSKGPSATRTRTPLEGVGIEPAGRSDLADFPWPGDVARVQ